MLSELEQDALETINDAFRKALTSDNPAVVIGTAANILIWLVGPYARHHGIPFPEVYGILCSALKTRLEEDFEKAKREIVH